MATIKDVAKKAGVSVSTVSYTLSGVRSISDKTRQRVQQAIKELNYHPNLLARGLINKRTKIIALLYPIPMSSLDGMPVQFITSVTSVAYERNYGLLLFTHHLSEQEIQEMINQGLVDGVILMEVLRRDPRVTLMKQSGYPFSLIGHGAHNDGISFVDMDFYTAHRLAVEHLAELKHTEIGFIPHILDIDNVQYTYIRESIRGFRETVSELGIKGSIQGCDSSVRGGYEAMNELLKKQPGLSAVIVGNEMIYNGVGKALQEKGLNVPADFSVIGTGSKDSAERYTPEITTIAIPTTEMGQLGTKFLIAQLENQQFEPQQVILQPEFIVRETTGPRRARV